MAHWMNRSNNRMLFAAASAAMLLAACNKPPLDTPADGTTAQQNILKYGGHDFLTVDAGWNAVYGTTQVTYDCYDGACHYLGRLHSNWNGTAFSDVYYTDCISPKSFTAADNDGHSVTFQWNTHNWIVPSDGVGGLYEVLELDIHAFQPCMYDACHTPLWQLSDQSGTAVWGVAYNDPACPGEWIEKKYLWQSYPHAPFTPC